MIYWSKSTAEILAFSFGVWLDEFFFSTLQSQWVYTIGAWYFIFCAVVIIENLCICRHLTPACVSKSAKIIYREKPLFQKGVTTFCRTVRKWFLPSLGHFAFNLCSVASVHSTHTCKHTFIYLQFLTHHIKLWTLLKTVHGWHNLARDRCATIFLCSVDIAKCAADLGLNCVFIFRGFLPAVSMSFLL